MTLERQTTVLIADDEPAMRGVVGSHLRARGYRVIEAADGEEAWARAIDSLPDLVVLDVMMPGMSGWEVCRKIREAVSLAHTGVIMLTGIGQHLNEMTSPLYGADGYLDKPFQLRDLDQRLAEALARRQGGELGRHEGAGLPPARERATASRTAQAAKRKAKAKPAKAAKPAKGAKAAAKPAAAKKPAKPAAKPAAAKKPTKPAAKPAAAKKPAKAAAKPAKPAKPAKKPAKAAAKPAKPAKPAKAAARPAKPAKPAKKPAKPAKKPARR